jgi:hypothetical protein
MDVRGYKAVEVQPVGVFPHTANVETICLMYKKVKFEKLSKYCVSKTKGIYVLA